MVRTLTLVIGLALLAAACVTGGSTSSAIPPGAELDDVEPLELPASAYHPVDGWPGWVCAESPDGKHSQWYFAENGVDSVSAWSGTCDSWKPTAAAVDPLEPDDGKNGIPGDMDREPGEISEFRVILGWPDWRCADYKDGRAKSVWYLLDQGPNTAVTRSGNCESSTR